MKTTGTASVPACRRDETYTNKSMACKTVADRALAYGMKAFVVDGNNVNEVYDRAREAVEYARSGQWSCIHGMQYVQMGHSTSWETRTITDCLKTWRYGRKRIL